MLQLIRKDIAFNRKWALLLVLVAILMPPVFYIDRQESRLILWVYIIGGVLANSHFVSRSCYLDDNAQTRGFLASLPVRKAQLVLSKYLLGLLCMVVSIGLTSLSAVALGLYPGLRGALIASVYLLLYYAIFLGVFFRFDYGSAEKANAALQMLAILSAFVIDRSGGGLDGLAVAPAVLPAAAAAGLMIYAASAALSIRAASRFCRRGRGDAKA